MDGFLEPALRRLLKDVTRKQTSLKESLSSALERLTSSASPSDGNSPADDYLPALLMACKSGQPKLVVTSLDCLQKLMSYGYLQGQRKASEIGLVEPSDEEDTVMDVVVQTICACEDTDGKSFVPDESVQLQVIKALLTAVTCASCGVHETSLLNSVRACYHIHLYSRNTVNKTTAKATLTQMMNAIFQQMEIVDVQLEKTPPAATATTPSTIPEEEEPAAAPPSPPSDTGSNFGGCMYPEIEKSLNLTTKLKSTSSSSSIKTSKSASKNAISPFRSIQHKDAYLLFRALCKLSMKNNTLIDGSGEEPHIPDPVALRSKILSLDLVLNILENSGPAFRNSRDFLYAIKTYLCSSLIKNCVSSNTQVVGLSLRIFVALHTRFAQHLKAEIELVISKIFLPILESSNSPHEHRVLVLEVFLQICKDVRTLVGIFLSYDCDWDSMDLYTRIVKVLSKIASEPVSSSTSNMTQEESQKSTLHAMSLKSIVSVVESLAEFTHLEDQLPTTAAQDETSVVSTPIPVSPTDSDILDAQQIPRLERSASNSSINSNTDQPNSKSITSDSLPPNGVGNRRKLMVDSFQQKQKYMRDVERAASKFLIKPKKGIDYLVEQKYIDYTPEDVAATLLQFKDVFSKTVIGEYLGTNKEFNIAVLQKYVDLFSFENRSIDVAVREFLTDFRLPSEAQQIDRVMESFAARFFEDNPSTFPSADTAFVLAFSIIMLNTDLHNPNIAPEKKMTKEDFLRNNRGIAGGRDLDPEYLGGIYDRIKQNEITLKEDDGERAKLEGKGRTGGSSIGIFGNAKEAKSRRQRAAFSKERQEIVDAATSMLSTSKTKGLSPGKRFQMLQKTQSKENMDKASNGNGSLPSADYNSTTTDTTYLYDSNDHVAPMFAVTWAPFCAVYSVNMQRTDEFVVINTVVNGMKSALRIACRFGMDDERKTLFDALIKFTLLNSNQEMRAKHIECVRAVVEVVQNEGDYLGSSWEQAVMCFSQLARMQLYSSESSMNGGSSMGNKRRSGNTSSSHRRRSSLSGSNSASNSSTSPNQAASGDIFSYFQQSLSPEEQARITDENNAEKVLKRLDMIQIDRIFLDSVNLGTSAIIDLVNALCAVSSLELHLANEDEEKVKDARRRIGVSHVLDSKPRIFSLQKIVEVADSNMDVRPRFIWGRIWHVLSLHFSRAGCHQESSISMFAVDSLRQLSVKFLEKDELTGFNFQLQFMQPFENMMKLSKSKDSGQSQLRDLILRCVENIVLSRSGHLKSGWQVVLHVISIGGCDNQDPEVSKLAFSVLQRIVANHFDAMLDSYFDDLVTCIYSFAENEKCEEEISGNALKLLGDMLDQVLSRKDKATPASAEEPEIPNTTPFSLEEDREVVVRLWPLVRSLAQLVGNSRSKIRNAALSTLFGSLEKYSVIIGDDVWVLLMAKCFIPLFSSIKTGIRPFSLECLERITSRTNNICLSNGMLLEEVEFEGDTTDDDSIHNGEKLNDKKQFPLPDPVSLDNLLERKVAFSATTLYSILMRIVDLLVRIADGRAVLSVEISSPFLYLLERFILSDQDDVSNSGTNILSKLLNSLVETFDQDQWKVVSDLLVHVMDDSTPSFLIDDGTRTWLYLDEGSNNKNTPTSSGRRSPSYETDLESEMESAQPTEDEAEEGEKKIVSSMFIFHKASQGDPLPFSSSTAFIMCSVQLQMLELIGNLIPNNVVKIGEREIVKVLDMIERSVQFARNFNDDLTLRLELQKRGFMQSNGGDSTPPTLLRQETLALGRYIHLLFRLDQEFGIGDELKFSDKGKQMIEERLEKSLHTLFMHYLFQDRMLSAERDGALDASPGESDAEAELRSFTPVISLSLREVLRWNTAVVKKNLPWLYPLLTALLDCGNREVHATLRQIFEQHISRLLGLDVNK